MSSIHVKERVARRIDLGVRFWDTATATSVIDDLQVDVFTPTQPTRRSRAVVTRSGVYAIHTLPTFPGLRDHEFSDEPAAASPADKRPYRVEVRDPLGRFLPLAFNADLPMQGLFTSNTPWLSPPQSFVLSGTSGSPPQLLMDRVPLFSAPTRPVPEPLAAVRAQLHEFGTGREVAWSCLGVLIDGMPRGLGLADEHGRVAVLFPYPEPPRMTLASPPEARNDFTWPLELVAFWTPASPPPPVPDIPDLADMFAALAVQRAVVGSLDSPSAPLRLTYRQPLTARTAGASGTDASYLAVTA